MVCWSAPRVTIPAVYSSPLPRFIRPSCTPVLTPCRECTRYSSHRAQIMVGVAGFEPATSSFRTKSASRLRYTPEMARCTGLEPVSLDRQSSCLTRCITAQNDRGSGLLNRTSRALERSRRDRRNLVCLARLERALDALSTRSLCHWGTGTRLRSPSHREALGRAPAFWGLPRRSFSAGGSGTGTRLHSPSSREALRRAP